MKKTLLVIENDHTLERANHVNHFMKDYDGEIIVMTGFGQRKTEEIFKNVSKCTDVAVQTVFIGGSDGQLQSMIGLFAKISKPINVYIAYMNSRGTELYDYFVDNLTPEQLISIEHHNIFAMNTEYYDDNTTHLKLDFTSVTKKLHKELTKKRVYKTTAAYRPTGRKILVLGCTANGKPFENLPIGQEVDELECSELSKNGKSRGVWIMGNGEPITLVNDCGFTEYKVVSKMSIEEVLTEIGKAISFDLDGLKSIEYNGLLYILKDDEDNNMTKANIICEELKVPKRGNRQRIYTLLNENLVVSI